MAGFVKPLVRRGPAGDTTVPDRPARGVNTRNSLWADRWPAIALQVCIDAVEAAPPDKQPDVKAALPCHACPEAGRCLNAKRKEIGPVMYDRELLTVPRSSGSSLFPREMFKPMLHDGMALTPFWRKPFGRESEFRIVQAWDIAWSEKVGGDWLVNMTGAIDLTTGEKQLIDISRWQQIGFNDQVKMIEDTWRTYDADLVVIESDAAQAVWSQHMSKTTMVPVIPHSASDKQSLSMGVPGLLIQLANRKWVFPYQKGTYHHENVDTFLAEAEAFAWKDGKLEGVGAHDDTVMCWWHLSWGLDLVGNGEAMGEHLRGVQDAVH